MVRAPKSGYARLAQEDELHNSSDEEDDLETGLARSGRTPSSQQQQTTSLLYPHGNRHGRRVGRMRSSSSGVDIKAINARLERWADEIRDKLKIGKSKDKNAKEQPLEIYYSVFVAPEGMRPVTADYEGYNEPPYNRALFDEVVESVRTAIGKGVQPKLITQGSSGSYFARNTEGQIVAVFKPKDEEPYGNLNPKWTKWLHRNLFPCFFGRSCLIPNLSYVSEAAASLLDRQLRTFLVPYTDLVWLSSKAFHYDYWDRRAFYRKGKPFPDKVGSFQVFLQGFKDANVFLKEHPWPDRYNSSFRTRGAAKNNKGWTSSCRVSGADDDMDEAESDGSDTPADPLETEHRKFFWTDTLQQSFREELEKLVILDYIMRNTDRGLDNWMVKIDWETQQAMIASRPLNLEVASSPYLQPTNTSAGGRISPAYKTQQPMSATSRSTTPTGDRQANIHIGAIDNSLAFPWKHPDQWRSFPYGWLFLPVSLIGQPFSQKTREHFLPLLTSSKWWAETQTGLKEIFQLDNDFKDRMWAKQLAVLKGQAFNVVETLKSPDQGPLELTRRTRVHIWDDEMEIPVAMPLRVPSSDLRRQRQEEIQEEMDIGASSAPVIPENDVLRANKPADLPSAGRFEAPSRTVSMLDTTTSREDTGDIGGNDDEPVSPVSMPEPGSRRWQRHQTSQSIDFEQEATKVKGKDSMGRRRGASITFGNLRRGSGNIGYDDNDEGDLGFSAAEDMEGSRRKVIVERLEAVKSKPPVFTWC